MEITLYREENLTDNIKLDQCPNCTSVNLKAFYQVKNIPVHNVLVCTSRQEAVSYPKGDITLYCCSDCGFIFNAAFNLSKLEYSAKCEESQGFSPTFNEFHKKMILGLIDKFDLHNKDIIEIGCGKGEFLSLLCELGNNRGVGFDPAYIPERNKSNAKDRIVFIQDFYSEKYSHYKADFIACKMTLEHIPNTLEFVSMVRRAVGTNSKTIVFFQVPDVTRVLKDLGFWDIYYEHCSYFSPGSLSKLFLKAGFEILEVSKAYDGQYLMIEARPAMDLHLSSPFQPVDDREEVFRLASYFSENTNRLFDSWRTDLKEYHRLGKKVVIWGGGSKGVAFLTSLGVTDEIKYVVDINPYKHGTFMIGSGHEVISPAFLESYRPDIVIVMNPIYVEEIKSDLLKMGLNPEILPIDYKT